MKRTGHVRALLKKKKKLSASTSPPEPVHCPIYETEDRCPGCGAKGGPMCRPRGTMCGY